jgi:hypothetical protein
MPDILDGETKRKNFNKELEVLQDEYFKIPFEPTKNRDEAKQIVKLFQEELEGKYSGWQYSLLDENIRGHIISPLLH